MHTYILYIHTFNHRSKYLYASEMGDAEKPDFEMALVNPVILSQSSDKKLGEEGCLSFPMIYGNVERSEWIEVLTMYVCT